MIDNEKEYTISEVAELTNYQAHVLRYYEKEFELNIPRNEANHRYYTYKEIESLNYIKSLQEKGFTNKQIKLILNSPEILVNEQQETAITSMSTTNISDNNLKNINSFIKNLIINEIKPAIIESNNENSKMINHLRDEIVKLRKEINSQERDILVTENAKLRMKVKEKSYEVAQIREKVKRLEHSKGGIFRKIFNYHYLLFYE